MVFSYEHYMNLLFHLDHAKESVPPEIAKRIVSNAIAPVITVTSTPQLDNHIQETYNIDSLYMLLRYFGGCVSDRDQANELVGKQELDVTHPTNPSNPVSSLIVPSGQQQPPLKARRGRSRSNSLFQRDSTQSQYIRFTKPIDDIVAIKSSNDMLFDYHSLEIYLEQYLQLIATNTNNSTPYELLKNSIYHNFFSLAISSTTQLSPYETFNHPIVSLIAVDISMGQTYDDIRDLLVEFKNLNTTTPNFPIFMNTNDMLPIFLLCYDANYQEQFEICQSLTKRLKKQLFVESLILPLWNEQYEIDIKVDLHQPIMSSLEEMIYFLQTPFSAKLSISLINSIYNILDSLIYDLMLPFMKRKLLFWEETILQPRRSLFHGAKFLKKFMTKNNNGPQENILTKDSEGNEYFAFSSTELLMRKLADWSMMISDFKTAYSTYESLSRDLDTFPKYLASCLEWCATSLLMGAQSIVTVKMIKNDINPLIERALQTYENCAITLIQDTTNKVFAEQSVEPLRSYETRCMILLSELFLSLSDTWTSTPYAITYLETILTECKLGPCSQIQIWERLSDCYKLRIDPRIRYKINDTATTTTTVTTTTADKVVATPSTDKPKTIQWESDLESKLGSGKNILSKGFTRRRKSAFFRLIAAKKWAEQKQWRQVAWCLKDMESIYDATDLGKRDDLIVAKLRNLLDENIGGDDGNFKLKDEKLSADHIEVSS
ncbi:Trs85p NDAI_0J01410 [Naumovozyma dairenensis CBS 421]|uniref:Trafficking protein particle complex III-specific subunit 85 n=1 Tax=Naumovozyma dairenensis (strain ATCC 10597 / BCRC 20456 / CBS 421 / NBRC 0211 / NRRL Y-12639) TaxID=1071378 RepID=G0WGV5_NAUDC|nr:hypothetical protein NDAI_0J01410 [Naumovozyma dairenensis CBS 421]CCD27033.1 hypothetical protein NDAI_0J01410 [Naumovozyma dairenensis CBS 421]